MLIMICVNIFLGTALYQIGIVYQILLLTNSVGIFENRLDAFWKDQLCYFDYTADLAGVGSWESKSNVNSINYFMFP